MNIIQQYASGKHVHEIPCFQVVNDSTLITSPDHALAFKAMRLITNLQYWDRAWIVQEKILPSKATVVLGCHSMPWKGFIHAADGVLGTDGDPVRRGVCAQRGRRLPGAEAGRHRERGDRGRGRHQDDLARGL